MAREFSRAFYHSKAWKHTRDAYVRQAKGLCERCLRRGVYVKGDIVHHIKHLDPTNINDPEIALGFDNLELVCRDCHAEVHPEIYGKSDSPKRRYAFDENGNLIPMEDE